MPVLPAELSSIPPTGVLSGSTPVFAAAFSEPHHVLVQERASPLGFVPGFNASAILQGKQQRQLQFIATTFSSISILAAMCAIYWFCMMRRNFRRDLVLLLIFGDFWKSFWFLVFSTVTLSTGHIDTQEKFCQASGYFLQVGFEACDAAIFLMSLHMSLQIFPPKNSFLGHDGLYRARYYVVAAWLIVPNIMGALAFTNTAGPAYMSQGAFCSLPLRPIWYRLALSWVPRYMIWIFVMGVAIRIYRHVGYEFRVFGQENDQTSSVAIPGFTLPTTSTSTSNGEAVAMQRGHSTQSNAAGAERRPSLEDEVAPDDASMAIVGSSGPTQPMFATINNGRPIWTTPFGGSSHGFDETTSRGALPPSSDGLTPTNKDSRQVAMGVGAEDFALPPPTGLNRPRGSISTMTSMRSGGGDSFHETTSPALAPITEHNTSPSIASTDPTNKALRRRRKAIQRQLRLLFIYPVAYLILWVFPAVNHALNYSNHYVQNPIFAISVLNIFCQNVMGLCDVCIFCWREKPWRHIPGSDGTFSGSFFFWRYAFSSAWRDEQRRISSAFAAEKEKDAVASSSHGSQSGLLGSLKRWSMSISGRSGRQPSEGTTTTTTMTVPSHPTPPRRAVVAAGARPGGHHRRAHSGRSDRKVLEAEHARERLAMERADWSQNLQSLYDRQASAISLHQQQQRMSPGRKEWWDRNMSVDHDADDDNDDDVV